MLLIYRRNHFFLVLKKHNQHINLWMTAISNLNEYYFDK
jgi:hypothetical protein